MSAVTDITAGMANTTVNEASTGAENAAASGAGQSDAVAAIVAEGRRLYIGNLAYATTEGELNEFFKGFLV